MKRFLTSTVGLITLSLVLILVAGSSYALFIGGGNGPAANSGTVNLSKGLVGQWKLDGNLKDSTPYAGDCVQNGGTASFAADRHGNTSGAYKVNSTSSKGSQCSVGSGVQNAANITYSAWVEPDSWNTNGNGILSLGTTTQLYFDSTGHLTLGLTDSTGTTHYLATTSAYTTGSWYHVAATYDGSTMRLYVNGAEVINVGYATGIRTSSTTLLLGDYWTFSSGRTFLGSIDDARVYNRALSSTEITALYGQYGSTSKAGSGQKGLVGWWKMDGNVADATPYNTVCNAQYFTPSYTNDRYGVANSAFTIGIAKLGFNCGQPTVLCTSNVTVSAWVNPSSYDSSGSGIESYGGVVQFFFDPSGFLKFIVHDTSNTAHTFTSPSAYATGSWYHVAATYDGSTINMYVNGANVLSTSYTGGIGTSHCADAGNNFLLSNYGSGATTKGFLGSLDDIRYYNRALSQTEITNLYNSYDSQISLGGDGGTSSTSINLQKGLVGSWSLEGNLSDATPYSTVCAPQFFTPTYVNDRHGRANSAISISAKLGADCGVPAALKAPSTTISAWVDPTTWNSGGNTIAGWTGAIAGLDFTSSGNLEFYLHDSSNVPHSFVSPSAYSLNQWYHVAATYDGSNVVLYVNGSAVSTTSYTGGIGTNLEANPYSFDILGDGSTTDGFMGNLNNIRVYNRALNATEVQALYNEYQ